VAWVSSGPKSQSAVLSTIADVSPPLEAIRIELNVRRRPPTAPVLLHTPLRV
jgi:hypothetical protein